MMDDLDKDVGGKYSEGTYGNASTVRIRGTFREDGSGLAMIYYKLISGEMDESEILEEGKSFFANYKTLADGYFAPLKKDKYEDDFDEYELSDSSKRGEEEEEYEDDDICDKFIPKWAKDKEYISSQLNRQNNNKELVFKSFGNFVVEHLNLNMIFETHNDNFDMRNSTADWRGDDSITNSSKNKYKDNNDNDLNEFFPNRKLQFV